MIATRKVVKANLRNAYRNSKVLEVENYGTLLRETLLELAPDNVSEPNIALLTPGIYNSAFYEHMFLAREIGAELVEGRDLLVNDGFVYMRTTQGLRRVDVIYRRVDDDFVDPLVFRPDSILGVPGLIHAYRLGNVMLANAPGTGIADDKSIYAYVPDIIRYYLDEEPILSNVQTNLCRRPEGLEYTLDNLQDLVVKEVGGSGGYGMLVGPHASPGERNEFAEHLRANPTNYISQPDSRPIPLPLPHRRQIRTTPRRHSSLRPARQKDPHNPRWSMSCRIGTRKPRRQLQPGRWRQRLMGTR